MTDAVVQPVLLRYIPKNRLKPVEQKYRKEMLRRKERFRDSLEEKKSAILLKNAMTLVQAVFPLQSENLPMV